MWTYQGNPCLRANEGTEQSGLLDGVGVSSNPQRDAGREPGNIRRYPPYSSAKIELLDCYLTIIFPFRRRCPF
jgi:hypothetical protein